MCMVLTPLDDGISFLHYLSSRVSSAWLFWMLEGGGYGYASLTCVNISYLGPSRASYRSQYGNFFTTFEQRFEHGFEGGGIPFWAILDGGRLCGLWCAHSDLLSLCLLGVF